MKPILVLDFDGVIHSYTTLWLAPDHIPDPPVTGALRFMQQALEHFRVAVFSSRSHEPRGIEAMQTWLAHWANEQSRHLDDVDHSWLNEIEWPTVKPPAFLTIDDRAIMFTGTWPALADLKSFKPWNKT